MRKENNNQLTISKIEKLILNTIKTNQAQMYIRQASYYIALNSGIYTVSELRSFIKEKSGIYYNAGVVSKELKVTDYVLNNKKSLFANINNQDLKEVTKVFTDNMLSYAKLKDNFVKSDKQDKITKTQTIDLQAVLTFVKYAQSEDLNTIAKLVNSKMIELQQKVVNKKKQSKVA